MTKFKPIRYPLPLTRSGSFALFEKEQNTVVSRTDCSKILLVYCIYFDSMPNTESKYLPLLNVQHMPSSVGKKEKYSMHGSVSPSQLQSMIMSEHEGAVCVIVSRLIVSDSYLLRILHLPFPKSWTNQEPKCSVIYKTHQALSVLFHY